MGENSNSHSNDRNMKLTLREEIAGYESAIDSINEIEMKIDAASPGEHLIYRKLMHAEAYCSRQRNELLERCRKDDPEVARIAAILDCESPDLTFWRSV